MARHTSRSRSPKRDRYDDDRKRRRSRSRERDRDRDNTDRDDSRRKERRRSGSRDSDRKKRKRDKSAERKARKAEKRRLREEEDSRQIAELSAYSTTDNPFNDVNLGQQFRWQKKIDKDKKQGLSLAESQRRDAVRRQEAKEELERLNRRRAEREVDQQLREEEELRMQRLAETEQMADWLAKEGDFQLEQERRRAGIRLKEKRGKAVDFLVMNLKYVNASDDKDDGLGLDDVGLEIDLDEPYAILENLTLEQTEELHDDIDRYLTLEQSQTNLDFWTNMMVVCKNWLETRRAAQNKSNDASAIVGGDVSSILTGKSYEQLSELQRQVQSKLVSNEPIDVEYWEGLLKNIIVWKSKSKLKTLHEVVVRNRLEQLRKRQRDEALQAQEELLSGVASNAKKGLVDSSQIQSSIDEKHDEISVANMEPYDRSMSPELLDRNRLSYEDKQIEIVDAIEDLKNLLNLRREVAASRYVPKVVPDVPAPEPEPAEEIVIIPEVDEDAMFRREAEDDFEEEEEPFNMEETIARPTSYNWDDKYRPRKPRYFNRVHTGYEWNKYNQTHYDTDNPPPKVVQGYKFNIFYPDLIDKSKAPTYKIIKEPGNDDTVLLYFTAGPPYEDIAFRIVNRDWEYSHRRGFRSSFDRGCLSLWFNFRRNFYRK